MNAQSCTLQQKLDKLSITGHTWGFSAHLPKESTSRRNAINAHNTLYFGDSDSVGRYFAITHWNVWDGLMVRVGIIIFHLFFILILFKRARRSERGKLVRFVFLWCLAMFLRGVLEVGHGGPEERANKQVAEGGRGETLIPCCARPLNSNEKPCLKASPKSASNSPSEPGQHGELGKTPT